MRICLPMQGTQGQSRIQEDPTGRGATRPVWETTEPPGLEPELRSQRNLRDEKAELRSQRGAPARRKWRPSTAKNKMNSLKNVRWVTFPSLPSCPLPPPAWNHRHGTHKNRGLCLGPPSLGSDISARKGLGTFLVLSRACGRGGGTPCPLSSEQAIQRWCSPHHVTSDALRLFSLVTAFSEPSSEKMQSRSCSRAEVLGTPAPSTPRPAHHGAITLVCVGRFTVKREEEKQARTAL